MYTSRTRFGAHENGGRVFDQVRDCASEAVERADALVRRNPASSTLITFAVGCGLGFLAVLAFTPRPRRQPWYRRPLPRGMTRSRLARTIEDLMPEAVSRVLSGKS